MLRHFTSMLRHFTSLICASSHASPLSNASHRLDYPRAARQDTRNLMGTLTRLVDGDVTTHAERRGLRLLRTPP